MIFSLDQAVTKQLPALCVGLVCAEGFDNTRPSVVAQHALDEAIADARVPAEPDVPRENDVGVEFRVHHGERHSLVALLMDVADAVDYRRDPLLGEDVHALEHREDVAAEDALEERELLCEAVGLLPGPVVLLVQGRPARDGVVNGSL